MATWKLNIAHVYISGLEVPNLQVNCGSENVWTEVGRIKKTTKKVRKLVAIIVRNKIKKLHNMKHLEGKSARN